LTVLTDIKNKPSNSVTAVQYWITITWIAALLVVVFFIVYIDVDTPIIVISGSSMTPAILPGDLAFVKREHVNDIKTNDIIAFKNKSESHKASDDSAAPSDDNKNYQIVVHRVVAIARDEGNQIMLTTKGDFNFENDDDFVKEANYIGRVYLVVPKLGNIITNPVLMSLVIAILIGCYLYSRTGANR
jgi:signal peptidase I